MNESEENAEDQESLLTIKLLHYYDEFVEFHEDCTFLCEAFAALVANSANLDPCSIGGFERNAHWLKQRAGELRQKIKLIREMGSGKTT